MGKTGDIVLVTGGSGFLGQHIIRMLIAEKEKLGLKEIRSVDLVPYENRIGHHETEALITFVGDICKPETIEKAFTDVDCVFHCASLISIQFPPNFDELERVNITGTKNIIDLCIKYNVPRMVYTSTAFVTFTPYMGHSTFSVVINQTESRAATPAYDMQRSAIEFDKGFLIPGYPSTKLRAESIVLSSSGATLSNGNDYLHTIALRPPLMYGEEDRTFMAPMLTYMAKNGMNFPRIAGAGGKQQLVYAGNVAWGHLCAYKALKKQPNKIEGLPVFITDDTSIHDVSRFIQRIGRETESLKFGTSWWSTPHFLFFFLAFLYETLIRVLNPIFGVKLQYSLRAFSSYSASVLMYNRLRASLYLDYEPYYDEKKSLILSANWYEKWFRENIGDKSSKKVK